MRGAIARFARPGGPQTDPARKHRERIPHAPPSGQRVPNLVAQSSLARLTGRELLAVMQHVPGAL